MTAISHRAELLAGRYGFRHAARMEWIKLRSLRSSVWVLATTAAGMIVIGIVTIAATEAPQAAAAEPVDPLNNLLAGLILGQLLIGGLGVLVVTGEYSSGAIRSTLAAIPNRRLLLAAKAGVFGAAALVVGELVTFGTFFAGRLALTEAVARPGLGDPGVIRALVLFGVYLAMVGLIGIALGAVLRHTAAAIGTLAGVLFVVPGVLAGLTGTTVAKFFPTMIAGNSLAVTEPADDVLSPWAGFAVLCLYVSVALAAGGWMSARRDA
ncbi:ABC transporter permease [Phytoactinopolyspora halotolerans]|uniref:ABC transporter permease n=1 Tax=Phytoactinopolyspora halotolerans TaxID=1981512 RepID=A0A6L9S840_9ACTN|nr:ABC transporter permease [Phytoactinopolyspora halotolerans]NEE01356.1 ABC transporter permease [Phytoactinopolyspora halotolerans]